MKKPPPTYAPALIAVTLLLSGVLALAFLSHRAADVGQLPTLARALPLSWEGQAWNRADFTGHLRGAGVGLLIVLAWFGLGGCLERLSVFATNGPTHPALAWARRGAVGAGAWSLVWLGLGTAGLYRPGTAWAAAALGLACLCWLKWGRRNGPVESAPRPALLPADAVGWAAFLLVVLVLGLGFIGSLAPPTAKDTLLYHYALPKHFVATGGHTVVPYNMAGYIALGVEMHGVWGFLLGGHSQAAQEAAAGLVNWAFTPLLVLFIYGWAREHGATKAWAWLAVLLVVSVPTAWYVSANAYIDLALTLYVAIAAQAVGRWWTTLERGWLAHLAVAAGCALCLKLTAVFVLLALGLVVLWRARQADSEISNLKSQISDTTSQISNLRYHIPNLKSQISNTTSQISNLKSQISDTTSQISATKSRTLTAEIADIKSQISATKSRTPASQTILLAGGAALVVACLLASPWYIKTWQHTGSPFFPFYLNLWAGSAPGWDVERSQIFQEMNRQYGGAEKNLWDFLSTPVKLATSAQPDLHQHYDGVLGIAFVCGLPLLLWGLRRSWLPAGLQIAVFLSGLHYLFWLFSSQQLRYLLPALPGLAVALAMTAARASQQDEKRSSPVLQWSLLGASLLGVLTTAAWFCQLNPLGVVAGCEPRAAYLARHLDYYPYYQQINATLPPDARVWLVNMRRDTYHLERPYFSDYLFEDYTLNQMVNEARDVNDLRRRVRGMGVTHLLVRHDVLFDPARSVIVDPRRSDTENRARMQLLTDFLTRDAQVLRQDSKFLLVELPSR